MNRSITKFAIIENIEMLGKAMLPDITPDIIKYRKVSLFLVPKCQNHGFFGSEISTEISFGHIFCHLIDLHRIYKFSKEWLKTV